MRSQVTECRLIDVPKPNIEFRSFSKDFAVKLADSILIEGLIQPIVIRPNPGARGRYVLVCGRHRYHAVAKVLKQPTIDAIVRDDLDESTAEQLALAENLWQWPLKKPQHLKTTQKWSQFYLAWFDGKAGRGSQDGASGHTIGGRPTLSGGATMVKSDPRPENGQVGGDDRIRYPSGCQIPPADSGARLEKPTPAAASRKRTSARSTKGTANLFSPDDIEVFKQMSVGVDDQKRIAAIKDDARRKEIIDRIGLGLEPWEALDHEKSEGRDVAIPPSRSCASYPTSQEMSDREWVRIYCDEKRTMFGDPTRYEQDAILYRQVRDAVHDLKLKTKKCLAAGKLVSGNGPLFWALYRLCYLSHPRDWLLCSECRGKGQIGPNERCRRCFGAGYALNTEVPLGAPKWERHSERR